MAERKIFQPTALTGKLLECACSKQNGGKSLTDVVNQGILALYTPSTPALRKETEFIFKEILFLEDNKTCNTLLKATMSRCVATLRNHPITDCSVLEQILFHFTYKKGHRLRYDYVQIVDEQQDGILRHLNDILKSLDSEYRMSQREFGERSNYIFEHWSQLYNYSEIYTALATIIECEDVYYDIDAFRAITLIKWLDKEINESNVTAIKESYPTSISITDRYWSTMNSIVSYYSDSAYVALTYDGNFDRMPQEIRDFHRKLMNLPQVYKEPSEKELNEVLALEREGRMLFRRLHK